MTDITVITKNDIGATLTTTWNELNVRISDANGNRLTTDAGGLFVPEPLFGTMANEDKSDYYTKTEADSTFATSDDLPVNVTDLVNDAGYITADDVPADRFLNNAELVTVNGNPVLRLTLSDQAETTFDVNLQDLIPVEIGAGLVGDGRSGTPIEVDTTTVAMKSDLGTMAGESKDDYLKKSEMGDDFVSYDDLTIELKSLSGSRIGFISASNS